MLLRIERYFQVQDYALWDVIENGNSFNPVPRTIDNADDTSTSTILDLDTMSIDDLYNNFKIVEQEVKRTVPTSSSLGPQNMAFLLTPGSTNEVGTTNIQVSTINTPVSTVSTHDNTANLTDATVSLRNQESTPRNQDSLRKTVNVEDTSSKAMVTIVGAGFDWSYMADDEAPTNMALMAFSDSE
nr:reverse transcriptase domain, reverse transcriptase zinc-binding domain protein [Tanacetum cinerariifolium]